MAEDNKSRSTRLTTHWRPLRRLKLNQDIRFQFQLRRRPLQAQLRFLPIKNNSNNNIDMVAIVVSAIKKESNFGYFESIPTSVRVYSFCSSAKIE